MGKATDFFKALGQFSNIVAAGVGAAGGFAGYVAASIVAAPFETSLHKAATMGDLLAFSAAFGAASGAALTAAILAYDNHAGLRGKWSRDLWRGLPLFLIIGAVSGVAGVLLLQVVQVTRSPSWLLMGAGIGAGIGLMRRDFLQAWRGAIGGALGGLIGGLVVDLFLHLWYTDEAFAVATFIGVIITGAMIALMIRAVQQALREAWLLGISTGPYEGKEYPLNTGRITVGCSELNDISLFRERELPPELGALVFEGNAWWWQGVEVPINGYLYARQQLKPGDNLQFGRTLFRFMARSLHSPVQAFEAAGGAVATGGPALPAPIAYAPPPPVAVPPPSAWGSPTPLGGPPPPVASALPSGLLAGPPASAPNSLATQLVPVASEPETWWLEGDTAAGTIVLPLAPAEVTVGRGTQNDVVLADPAVSGRHARLELKADGLTIFDLGSTNGTMVNDVRIAPQTPVRLLAQDRVSFGTVAFTVKQ